MAAAERAGFTRGTGLCMVEARDAGASLVLRAFGSLRIRAGVDCDDDPCGESVCLFGALEACARGDALGVTKEASVPCGFSEIEDACGRLELAIGCDAGKLEAEFKSKLLLFMNA